MSTFFFKITNAAQQPTQKLEDCLGQWKEKKLVENWKLNGQQLEVETVALSSEELKHKIREEGFDADFTTAPQAS